MTTDEKIERLEARLIVLECFTLAGLTVILPEMMTPARALGLLEGIRVAAVNRLDQAKSFSPETVQGATVYLDQTLDAFRKLFIPKNLGPGNTMN